VFYGNYVVLYRFLDVGCVVIYLWNLDFFVPRYQRGNHSRCSVWKNWNSGTECKQFGELSTFCGHLL